MSLSILILGYVTLERLAELVWAERNTRRLMARGAVETGAEHYPIIVGLHAAWLAGLWWWGLHRSVDHGWLAVYALLEVGRFWTLFSLGERWTTRIIVPPGEPLVRRGPYRFFPHPNYAIVAGEIAVLPIVFHLPAYAALFTALNASILWVRISAESQALRTPEESPPGVRRYRSGPQNGQSPEPPARTG